MIVTQLKQCCPTCRNPNDLTAALNDILPKYNIISNTEIEEFLAQCGHESNDFNTFQENLNYSAEGLQKTFHTHFTTASIAAQYERQPEKIANRVYAMRMGNGDERSGDGWAYHGRGAIQITGHDNYVAFAKYSKRSMSELSAYLITMEGAVESAAWYWTINSLNRCANNVEETTKKINGGLIGEADREARFERCINALK
jgi:putative chitinase